MLRGTLESLERADGIDELHWELLVVDNGSTDETKSVAAEFSSRLPLRYLVEPVAGLSHARNRAVREFRGDYIVWTDDDVRVGSRWLSSYAEAFERWPDAAVFGGPIRPEFEGAPPEWLVAMLPEVGSAFAVRDLSSEARELSLPSAIPYGANYAVRGDLQRKHRYDVELGYSPSTLNVPGEETKVIRSILEPGHTGWWVPEAEVRHRIPRDRQTISYLWKYYCGIGRLRVLNGFEETESTILGRPRWLWRRSVEHPARLGLATLRGDFTRIGHELRKCAIDWGMFWGGT